jgi:DNA invertase Pin-like site-specific DNA recombinase
MPTAARATGPQSTPTLGYASVGSGEPLDGPGIENQLVAIKDACERLNLRLLDVARDNQADGGEDAEQPGLVQVLDRIDSGEAACLIVSDLERLTPRTAQLETILDRLEKGEARLVALDVGLDSATEAGSLAIGRPAEATAPAPEPAAPAEPEAPAPEEPEEPEAAAPEPEPAAPEPEPAAPEPQPAAPEPEPAATEPEAATAEPEPEPPPPPPKPAPAPAPAIVRALGYATAPPDSEESTSELDRQRRVIERYCGSHGIEVVEVVREREPKDGKALDRAGLSFLIERIAAGDASCLVVTGLQRLSRSVAELGTIVQWLERNQVRLIAVELDLDTASPGGHTTARALASVAGMEHERLSERTRKGLAAARAKRHSTSRDGPDWEAIRKRIANMRADGMTLQAIADTLNKEGVPTQRGGTKWRPSSVQTAAGYKRPSRAKVTDLPAVRRGPKRP